MYMHLETGAQQILLWIYEHFISTQEKTNELMK